MKVCESLAVFDSPDLINLAFESSTGIQRAGKLENEYYQHGGRRDPRSPLGNPPGGLESTVRSKREGELLPEPRDTLHHPGKEARPCWLLLLFLPHKGNLCRPDFLDSQGFPQLQVEK